ncbi:glycosyl hydrolase [Paenibacillus faecis]|uniref:glycosyl hydrolase n=1 Tax=Paenibacillus faecis TaxID=862114 RepID=UPI002010FBEF|nr:glycosyl hydrolase [Paenibacillus faecis]
MEQLRKANEEEAKKGHEGGEQEGREQVSGELKSVEQESRGQEGREQVSGEHVSVEHESKEQEGREQESREQESGEQESGEHESRGQVNGELESREQVSNKQANKELQEPEHGEKVAKDPKFQVEPVLVHPAASPEARGLMRYLCSIYGRSMLTGQQIGVLSTPELDLIHEVTGRYPAVAGFDFMNYSPSRVERGVTCRDTDLAIDWWKNRCGIVTFCWHWNAPKDLIDLPPDRTWGSGFYTKATTFDVKKAMADTGSEEYRLILRDIDAIAVELKRLADARVPVLWRPLHEASGGWFWWGAKGPEPCIALWKLMYHRLTYEHGLNHLIWVWNGQHADWYPGDEFVDIMGEDIYAPVRDYSSQQERFRTAESYTRTSKIIALSENGVVPDPDRMAEDGTPWAWNCTWYGTFVYREEEDGRLAYSEEYTELEQLRKTYRHPRTITLEELPDWEEWMKKRE